MFFSPRCGGPVTCLSTLGYEEAELDLSPDFLILSPGLLALSLAADVSAPSSQTFPPGERRCRWPSTSFGSCCTHDLWDLSAISRGTTSIAILQRRELWLRDVECLAESHTACQWHSIPGLSGAALPRLLESLRGQWTLLSLGELKAVPLAGSLLGYPWRKESQRTLGSRW